MIDQGSNHRLHGLSVRVVRWECQLALVRECPGMSLEALFAGTPLYDRVARSMSRRITSAEHPTQPRYDAALMDRQDPQPLLEARLWPLTGSYAFFDADIGDVAEILAAWQRGLGMDPVEEQVKGGLEASLGLLQPMSLGHRELLVPTASPWTAYFGDGRTGADEAPVGQLAKMLRRRALLVTWWPVPGYWALRFQLYADHRTDFLNYERVVSVDTDDGGRTAFTATGTPQPYESVEAYRARRVRDRFTPAMLETYCRALGVQPFAPDFFGTESVLITSHDWRPDIRFTVADQQARYGFSPPRK